MRVCVIGTGYVGLVTGTCLARVGHHVICVDNNEVKVRSMQAGIPPIYEPGLTELMLDGMTSDRLRFATDLASSVRNSDILFIAVGTPPLPSGASDTRYVEAVARGIGQNLDDSYKIVVNKSTVPIGSGDWVRSLILEEVAMRSDAAAVRFDVVSNPEFLREGSAIYDTFNPDRIVLGANSAKAIAQMKELYAPLVKRKFADNSNGPDVPVVTTDLSSAETIKYAANAFLATKISFINEVANICDRVGADVTQVAAGIGLDSRIGHKFLQAGLGWGGSCFPKDVAALIHTAADYGYKAPLLNAAVEVNRQQRLIAIEKLQQALKILKGKTIGLLGLTFKPNTDDLRDTPARELGAALNRLGAKVKAYDPLLSRSERACELPNVEVVATPQALAVNCDALVLVTDWDELVQLDYAELAQTMRSPLIIDGRNCLDAQQLAAGGFNYIGIGRPNADALHGEASLSAPARLTPVVAANAA
ncbi:MAG: UDP-glucose/GDP-mannose dehydrogenase family protein [Cyanobacteria bacterium P01_D01_bin.123]